MLTLLWVCKAISQTCRMLTSYTETAIFDEGADLIDDSKSSETLDDEEPDMSAFEIEELKNDKLARSNTISSSRMSKRGFDEVDSEEEQSTETSGGSPGSFIYF
jgi:hypothetical protein